jgi:hypothetical protein
LQYIESGSGTTQTVLVNPTYANAAGTQAFLTVPGYLNGAFPIHILGASGAPTLQVVPLVQSATVTGSGSVTLHGAGFVEDNGSLYQLPGTSVTDTSSSSSLIDVFYYSGSDNTGVNLSSLPAFGSGSVTVTTTDGTSAATPVNAFSPALGGLYGLAVDPTSGAVWVGSYDKFQKLNPTTGQAVLTVNQPGNNSYYNGLQVLLTALTPGATAVPAGSLLVANGYANPTHLYALDANNGTELATLTLSSGLSPVAAVYDPNRSSLFLLRSNGQVVELNPSTGAQLNAWLAPVSGGYGGLALDPSSGDLWLASSQSNALYLLSPSDGTLLGTVALRLQGVGNELTGIAFDASGKLWAASYNGYVYDRRSLAAPTTVAAPTITAINASSLDGTPADGTQAAANVGQVITLVGSNFTSTTQVLFPTRDNNGNLGSQATVLVPDNATTGAVTVLGDASGTSVYLQVVPVESALGVSGVSSDGSYATVP